MKLCILIFVAIVLLFGIWCLYGPNSKGSSKEHFTDDRREYRLCPYITHRERSLMPNAVVLVVQGYNYEETPKLFFNDKYMRPLIYHWDSDSLTYYFTIDQKYGLCDGWTIETDQNVKPMITEGYSQTLLQVKPRFTEDKYIWSIEC